MAAETKRNDGPPSWTIDDRVSADDDGQPDADSGNERDGRKSFHRANNQLKRFPESARNVRGDGRETEGTGDDRAAGGRQGGRDPTG